MARRKSFLERMLGGESQQAKDQRERENRNVEAHVLRQAERRANLERLRVEGEQAKSDQEQVQARLAADLRDQNECLRFHLRRLTDVLRDREQGLATTPEMHAAAFRHSGPAAFVQAVQNDLCASPYPPSLPARTTVLGYRPDARELVIERELPRDSVVPPEQEYRVVKGQILPVPRKTAEVHHLYGQLLARIALRTIAEAFALTPPALVDSVVLNGRVTAADRATGQPIHPHLLSVQFDREVFEEIHLDAPALDPELCLWRNNALISPRPYDLVPVTPLLYYDLERYRTIANPDLLADLDRRLDLLGLQPDEFESLVRRLFETRGLRAWHTHARRDDGVEAVAVNEDPVLGGVVVIQTKRCSAAVPAEAVRALAGAMAGKRATKGILVTTSWVGRESIELARRFGRIQIIEGRELKQMLAATLNMNVLISLPTLPHGWERAQVA
jgi:restriction system protein